MAQKTIGQVLVASREDMQLSLSDVYNSLKIHRRYLRALEKDRFDLIPGDHQAKQLLIRYAEFLELDVPTILDAYNSHDYLIVYQLPSSDPRYTKLIRKKRPRTSQTLLPFLYLLLTSLLIVLFVGFTIWKHEKAPSKAGLGELNSYQVTNSPTTTSTSVQSTTTDTQAKDSSMAIHFASDQVVDIHQAPERVAITLSVNQTESWVALSGTELAQGILLTPSQSSVEVSVNRLETSQVFLQIGSLDGLSIKILDQNLDLSQLPQQPTTLILNFK